MQAILHTSKDLGACIEKYLTTANGAKLSQSNTHLMLRRTFCL